MTGHISERWEPNISRKRKAMNNTKILLAAGALLVSVGVAQQAAALGVSGHGATVVNTDVGAAPLGVTYATAGSNGIDRPRSGQGAGAQDLFHRTQGLSMAEMAGFGSLNGAGRF
jgi:hypothetical protein